MQYSIFSLNSNAYRGHMTTDFHRHDLESCQNLPVIPVYQIRVYISCDSSNILQDYGDEIFP